MTKNVGKIDRIIRLVIGGGILAAGIVFETYLGFLGLIPIATAIFGWCGPYALFGMSTCKVKNKE